MTRPASCPAPRVVFIDWFEAWQSAIISARPKHCYQTFRNAAFHFFASSVFNLVKLIRITI